MKKAVTKKPPGKKPEVKQVERCDWAIHLEGGDYPEEYYLQKTKDEALLIAGEWAEGHEEPVTLCMIMPLYKVAPPEVIPTPPYTVTCLATGETTTITL